MTQAAQTSERQHRRFKRRFTMTSALMGLLLVVAGSASALPGLGSLPVDAGSSQSLQTPAGGLQADAGTDGARVCADAGADGDDAYGHIDSARNKVPVDTPDLPVDVPRPSLPGASADTCISADTDGNVSADACADADGIEQPDLPDQVSDAKDQATSAARPVTDQLPVGEDDIPSGADACAHAFHSDGEVGADADSGSADDLKGKLMDIWSKFTGLF